MAILLCQFPDVIQTLTQDLMPHRLCEYLFQLAEQFHSFFHQCRVLGDSQEASRLTLCIATQKALQLGMALLGLKTVEKM